MIGSWEPPRIERISSLEQARVVPLPVPGLSGGMAQHLGRSALRVMLCGSLAGDEARDAFLLEIRGAFLAGEPVDFVADIVSESELERVLIESLEVEEVAGSVDTFRYRIVLREYTEPPEPPGLIDDLGLDDLIDLDALAGLDLLDLGALLGAVPPLPDLAEMLSPVEDAAASVGEQLGGLSSLFDGLDGIL